MSRTPLIVSRVAAHILGEARRLGIPFGRVCAPVGAPVERGYALLPWARAQDRG